jgi:hypothetical protein
MGPKELFDIGKDIYNKINEILKAQELNEETTKRLTDAQRFFRMGRFELGIDMCEMGTALGGDSYNKAKYIIGLGYYGLARYDAGEYAQYRVDIDLN